MGVVLSTKKLNSLFASTVQVMEFTREHWLMPFSAVAQSLSSFFKPQTFYQQQKFAPRAPLRFFFRGSGPWISS
jgi:hypothetical protein